MKTTSEIRSLFIDFFKRNNHTQVPSSSLIPHNDPTLLFTAAGMVQFKDVFTGLEKKSYTRAVSAQKCLRAGGKHNDLENVGYTNRHHTFFEMMGNFSFGDYFKEQAISYAWEFVTKELGLSKDRLVITVYSEDEEAADFWRKIAGLSDNKIIRISTSDNFWSAGDTGPCGPCSEIFYDHGSNIKGGPPGSPDAEGDRFVEIWNLVFMQYDTQTDGTRRPLPRPSIDTGMGLERISAILQNVHSNYDIDLFQALIQSSVEFTGVPYLGDMIPSHRVIADHLRAASFLIADGILPSNEGRGYVLRRIMRRAMRHIHLLGTKEILLPKLFPTLISQMGGSYPELIRAEALISETLFREETRFQETLDRGLKLLKEELHKLPSSASLPGEVAFKLYDTYGFPLDLTQDVLHAEKRDVNVQGFHKAMDKQKADARAAWVGSGDTKTESRWYDVREKLGTSDFLGYETLKAEGLITALFKDDHSIITAHPGDTLQILTNQTPFYGESGGQMGDMGEMKSLSTGANIRITNTLKKLGDLTIHEGILENALLNVGDVVLMHVDQMRRDTLRANHSATHILHRALQTYLGDHVSQKGSLVAPDKLRFDFSHVKPLTSLELHQIESWVNARIRENFPVVTNIMTISDAIASGAMALFGEKYADDVRVVAMGPSIELCGGTHVSRTGDIGFFKIIQESSVAAGIRRIEALTGHLAEVYVTNQETLLKDLCLMLKTSTDHLKERVLSLTQTKKQKDSSTVSSHQLQTDLKTISNISLLKISGKNIDTKDLKPMVDAAKQRLGSGVVVLLSEQNEKLSLVIGVTSDLMGSLNAIDLVQTAAQKVGGQGGGGRPDLAQAGGSDPSGIPAMYEIIENTIKTVHKN